MNSSDGSTLYAKRLATHRGVSVSTCSTVEVSDLRSERLMVDARTPETVIEYSYLVIHHTHLCPSV